MNRERAEDERPADSEAHMDKRSKTRLPRINNIRTVGATKWLALETIEYTDEDNKPRKWDMATRTGKQADTPDAVIIIPLLRNMGQPSSTTETILVEQYRIPVRSRTVEFPAGLIDAGETAEQAAIRELQEETGYIGHHTRTIGSRELCMTPGMVNETIKVVVVHVDLDEPRNHHPISNPDEGELLTIKRVPIRQGLTDMMENGTSMPIALLYCFALGFELGALSFGDESRVNIPQTPAELSSVVQIPSAALPLESSNTSLKMAASPSDPSNSSLPSFMNQAQVMSGAMSSESTNVSNLASTNVSNLAATTTSGLSVNDHQKNST